LYPLGRERQSDNLRYIHQGAEFPCLADCREVLDLPQMSVGDYIAEQATSLGEIAQDHYLEFMQALADGAFALLLESGLAESGDRYTLRLWRTMGRESPEALTQRLGVEWMEALMLPNIAGEIEDPAAFIRIHHDQFQSKAQESFGALNGVQVLREASGLMMGLALHLGRGLGANSASLAERWIKTAKKHGACE